MLTAAPMQKAAAEDIDLFVASSTTTASNPNILFIIDNTANWDASTALTAENRALKKPWL